MKIIGRKRLAWIYKHINKWNKNKTKYVGNCCATNASGDFYDIDWFNNTTEIMFENRLFKAPLDFNRVLERRYGDYMKLPPIEEQKSQHDFEAYIK